MADDRHTPPWVLITVAIIGAVGVIVAAAISKGDPKSATPLVVIVTPVDSQLAAQSPTIAPPWTKHRLLRYPQL